MKKPKTNLDIVKQIMTHSDYGALAQAFVIEAIREKAYHVSKHKPDAYPKNSIICAESWIGTAQEIKTKMDEFYS